MKKRKFLGKVLDYSNTPQGKPIEIYFVKINAEAYKIGVKDFKPSPREEGFWNELKEELWRRDRQTTPIVSPIALYESDHYYYSIVNNNIKYSKLDGEYFNKNCCGNFHPIFLDLKSVKEVKI